MKDILPGIIAALAPILLGLLAWAGKKLADFIDAKVASDTLKTLLIRTDTVIFTVVKAIAQVTVDAAKQGAADGKLPSVIAGAARDAALSKVKSYLGQPGLDALMEIMGLKDMATTEQFLASRIESAVRDVKVASPAPAAPVASAPNP
jgi:hypothetical protein